MEKPGHGAGWERARLWQRIWGGSRSQALTPHQGPAAPGLTVGEPEALQVGPALLLRHAGDSAGASGFIQE